MASVLSHPAVPLSLSFALGPERVPAGLVAVACAASLAPDVDSIGFAAGIPYGHPLGHRGLTHSISFAFVLALAATAFAKRLGASASTTFALVFASAISHGLLDAMTTGGLGVAFFSPFSNTRYFFPLRVILVSPIGITRFVSAWGIEVLKSELLWIWLPAAIFAAGGAAIRSSPPPRHLIYLHGRIVQEHQSHRPRSDRFGYYELDQILETFRKKGFAVSGAIRKKSATESESADLVVAEIRGLLGSGVPADRITVVGASMGAGIAMLASARLQNPSVRFVFLGACLSEGARRIRADEGKSLAGRILTIREESDETSSPCPPPAEHRELLVKTGRRHGFLYRPLPEWVDPAVEWATAP